MANEERKTRDRLHRHLLEYRGLTLTYEMVRKLMSFVFDMEATDPCISWISKDSHIRLLNGIFKKVGQTVDDAYITSLEDSIISSMAFQPQAEVYNNAGRLMKPVPPATEAPLPLIKPKSTPANAPTPTPAPMLTSTFTPEPATKSAVDSKEKPESKLNEAAIENAYQRILLDMAIFENRIARAIETTVSDTRDAQKRMLEERIELEARLTEERSVLESKFALEHAKQKELLGKEHSEIFDILSRFLARQTEQAHKAESLMEAHFQRMESSLGSLAEDSSLVFHEHTLQYENSAKKTEDSFDAYFHDLSQQMDELSRKLSLANKAARRRSKWAALGFAATAICLIAMLLLK